MVLDPKDYVTIMDMEKLERWYEQMKPHYEQLAEKYKELDKQAVLKNIRIEMPKTSIAVHGLPPHIQDLLNTKAELVMFSSDSLAKQLHEHPDLTVMEYRNVFRKIIAVPLSSDLISTMFKPSSYV